MNYSQSEQIYDLPAGEVPLLHLSERQKGQLESRRLRYEDIDTL